jgi:hypothetical protein
VGSPWDHSASAGGGDLARQAGIDDIGRDQHGGGSGLFDNPSVDDASDTQVDQDAAGFDDSTDFGGSDFGGGDFGGTDV